MNPTTKKLKLFYVPFLLIAIGLGTLYTFLNWLLIIKLQLFSLKDIIVNFGIPMALPGIPVLFYFRSRLKTLDLKTRKGSWIDFYTIILWLALATPIIIAQNYLEKASGKLTQLDSISTLDKQEQTKYYTLKKYYIDKSNIGVHSSFEVSGKYNDDFNMHLYVALPILGNAADTAGSNCLAWMGMEYSKRISNRLSEREKEAQFKSFEEQSQADFDRKDVNQFAYLDKVGNSDNGAGYKEAVKKDQKYSSGNAPVFLPVDEPFEKRLESTFSGMLWAFGIGALVWLIMILVPKFDDNELARFESGKPATEGGLKESLDFLIPKEGYFITPVLIYANTAVFLAMFFAGLGFATFRSEDLLKWGANYRPLTMNGEWWRLLTSTFLHGGIMHLVANMYGLLFVGIFLEPILGKTKYLFAYLLTGILASCASLWWYDATVSVGASGAIFGLYGVFLALLMTKVFTPEFAKPFLISTVIFVAFNLLMGLTGGTDNAAHIGGLVSGFILGLILRMGLKKEDGIPEHELIADNSEI